MTELCKLSFKRAEPSLLRFIDVAQIHIELLQQYVQDSRRGAVDGSTPCSSTVDHVRAVSTVRQLMTCVHNATELRDSILVNERVRADVLLAPVLRRMEKTLEEVGDVNPVENSTARADEASRAGAATTEITLESCEAVSVYANQGIEVAELAKDIRELHEMLIAISAAVNDQRQVVDSIADNVEDADLHLQAGHHNLRKTAKWIAFPVGGAAVGVLAGGPVGFVLGLKLGFAAALAGSLAGGVGGHFLSRRLQKSDTTTTHAKRE